MTTGKVRSVLASVAVGGCIGAGIIGIGVARADGVLSPAESRYVARFGASAICPVIARYPSEGGVFGIMDVIINQDGFAPDDAVDIINAAVSLYCPQYWNLLVRIGDKYRHQVTA